MKPVHSSVLTLLISGFLLSEGIWGLFSPVIYGILTTNRYRALMHLVLGIAGLVARRGGAMKACFGFTGSLLIVVTALWLLPSSRAELDALLKVNGAGAAVNMVVGLVALVVAFAAPHPRRYGTQAPFYRTK